ncbi:MAG: biotin--[acetyl-CoA-carboxylase] ligase [Candidatus Omnitrophica bacterium]|nr:biotin--[acetyl-CoA-carboxylase] ligase [Candidatus Omnitrophota bacterium]
MEPAVLALLKKNSAHFVSGEEISRRVRISRAAVWKQVRRLRAQGYLIESLPHRGYCLQAVPDCLLPEEISWKLPTASFGQSIVSFEKISSTNTAAYTLAEQGLPEGTLVVAERQTAGRGRLGRAWASPPGGIYASLIIRPDIGPELSPFLTLLTACAVTQAVRGYSGIRVDIKWPNDIYYQTSKIGGILTEMNAEMDCVHFVIIGFGLNVNSSAAGLPAGAGSLSDIAGKKINRVGLLQEILVHLESLYGEFRQERHTSILGRWREYSCTLGRRVRVAAHHEVIEGVAEDIDAAGALCVREANGKRRRVLSGDVELVREPDQPS